MKIQTYGSIFSSHQRQKINLFGRTGLMNYRQKNALNLNKFEKGSDDELELSKSRLISENNQLIDRKENYASYRKLVEDSIKKIKTINDQMITDFNMNSKITVEEYRNAIFIKKQNTKINFSDSQFLKNAKKISDLLLHLISQSEKFFKPDYYENITYYKKSNSYVTYESIKKEYSWFRNILVQCYRKGTKFENGYFSHGAFEFTYDNWSTNELEIDTRIKLNQYKEFYLENYFIHLEKEGSDYPLNKYIEILDFMIGNNDKRLRKIELIQRSRKNQKSKADNIGYIYVMSNEAYPDIYKIGSTYGLPEERAEELTGTGNLYPFIVEHSVETKDAEYFEKQIHKILDKCRVNKNREFFKLSLDEIKRILKDLVSASHYYENKMTMTEIKQVISYD